jgi:glycosyltransferase involved in cell wall biosynthesis
MPDTTKDESDMRIALATRSLSRGGAQIQLVNLACDLRRRGYNVSVVVLYDRGALEAELRRQDVPVICLGKESRWNVFGALFRYISVVRKQKFNVIYSYLPLENLLSLIVARSTGAALVWGLRCASVDTKQHGYASQLLYWAQRRLISVPDHVISNSRAQLEEMGQKAGERISVIPNGIDVVRFKPDPMARMAVRRELGISDREKLVGCVARIDPMKDHPTLLRAAALLGARRGDVRFVIVGSGDSLYSKSLHRLGAELGLGAAVSWLGERTDVERILNALDVYASASVAEGFSNALAEAMACGIIPAVTDAGDNATLVGDHGVIVPSRNPEQLADAMISALDRDSPSAREARRSWIVRNFGVERMVDASLRSLTTAMSAHPNGYRTST